MRAVATRTGALPRPVTQWTPMQVSGSERNSCTQWNNVSDEVMMSSWGHFHLVDQTEPLVHDVLGGGGAVSEAQLGHSHAYNKKIGIRKSFRALVLDSSVPF